MGKITPLGREFMMNNNDIAALFVEPACEHNGKHKTGCKPPKPGSTAGGCAFDGAQITLLPVADVAHLVHGPIGCAGSSWDNRGSRSSGPELNRLGFTTDLSEQDVIMGRGERRLFHAVRHIAERYRPAAIFIYNTCVPAMEGDDIESVCRSASAAAGIPVIAVDAAGFYGSKNLGNRIAGDVMLRQVVGQREPAPWPSDYPVAESLGHSIGLIGEYNIAGEFWQVLPLLDELGVRVLCTLSGDARFAEIQTLHRSEANMLVCSRALINVARQLKEQYGTPWFEGSFYGLREMSSSLRQLAGLLGDEDLIARTETLIAREEAFVQSKLAPWRDRLRGKRVLLYTGGVKSWSVVSALQDLGMDVVATGTRKSTEEDKARIRALMGEDALMMDEGNPRLLLDTAYRYGADMMIAGGRNMYTAYKARLPFLDINQEREEAFAGYQGMVNLAAAVCRTLESPVWPQVNRPAPWH
jgi:nitrogenase molybdenum-cofactor synthesis protein NifE